MHPVTLSFLDPNLEAQYNQQKQYKTIQKYTMIGTCIIFLLGSLSYLLIHFSEINIQQIISALTSIICSLLGIIFVLKYSQFANIGLFILNLLIVTNISEVQENISVSEGYISGGSAMMAHTLLLFVLQYPSSIINNFLLCFWYLFFCSYFAYIRTDYFVSILLSYLFVGIAIYLIEKLKRQSFLINQKDSILELIISQCVGKPMFVFYYMYLLDNTIYHKETLKQFIYKEFKGENHEVRYMRVKIEDENHVIRLQRKLIYFILAVETKDNFVKTLIQSQLNYSIKIQKYVQLMIKNISNIIGHSNVSLNYKLHHGLYQIIDYMHPKNPIGPLKKLFLNNLGPNSQDMMTNLSEKIKKFCVQAKNHHPINIDMNIQTNIYISCSPLIVNIYLLEIFKNLKSKKYYSMNLCKTQDEIIFEINGPIRIDETKIFKQFSNILVSQIKKTENGLQFSFYNESQVSFFYFK